MATLCVFSNSHGYSGNMLRVLSAGLPEGISLIQQETECEKYQALVL